MSKTGLAAGTNLNKAEVSASIDVSACIRLPTPVSYTVSFLSPTIQAARCVRLSTEPVTGTVVSVSAL